MVKAATRNGQEVFLYIDYHEDDVLRRFSFVEDEMLIVNRDETSHFGVSIKLNLEKCFIYIESMLNACNWAALMF